MNSINQQQAERNHEDLTGHNAVDRIKETVKKAQTCFFCTGDSVVGSEGIRPMNVRKVDDEGILWFLSADDSHKNLELEGNSSVVLLFQGSPHSDFLQLKGHASVSRDKAKIKELWEPILKTWFTEGIDDPQDYGNQSHARLKACSRGSASDVGASLADALNLTCSFAAPPRRSSSTIVSVHAVPNRFP
jgi:general stress protein 26